LKAPKSVIDRFVTSKEKWIRTNIEEKAARIYVRAAFALNYNSGFTLFGCDYPIAAGKSRGVSFDGVNAIVPPGLGPDDIKRSVILLYRAIARDILTERVMYFARLIGVRPAGIKITGAKTRWGSCSGKNNVNFSWRLVMADAVAVDYVVVHELAHIKEHNHSPRFWDIVKRILPDYKARQKQLKLTQKKLSAEDWDE